MQVSHKKLLFDGVRYALCCFGICGLVLFVALPVSCKMTEEGIEIVGTDKTAPHIIAFDVKQRSTLAMQCSEPVVLKTLSFKQAETDEPMGTIAVSYNETRTVAELHLSAPTEIGTNYELTGVAEDTNGNTLAFRLPFVGFNDNLPKMVFNEIRYKGDTSSPKYIEFYVLEDGNTAGLEVVSGYNTEAQKYVFPTLQVHAGEFITVHYCKEKDTFACESELGDDLTTANAKDAKLGNCDTARDLWAVADSHTRNFGKSDVLVLRDGGTNTIKDAVFYAEEDTEAWAKALQGEFAKKAVAAGIWESELPLVAADSTDIVPSKTLARKHIGSLVNGVVPTSAADWCITSQRTPGKANSTE